ncbi:MAG TPA: acetyl-CoA hydrolase/transferase C-terminal domain-containing protein [Syntrophomonas sp.]|jgi:acyl-CoA hydrolase|nr:acetyl-CoA hydrolase/transferase C-terminal domain-containing protein [Syntrophomonas sp.]
MSNLMNEFNSKVISAEKAAGLVKSGDLVAYGYFGIPPHDFDIALGNRVDELKDVTVHVAGSVRMWQFLKTDPEGKVFTLISDHFSALDRMLGDKGRAVYGPVQYHEFHRMRLELQQPFIQRDVICLTTTPMDSHGNFNFGLCNSDTYAELAHAKIVIVETNPNLPYCLGGEMECINLKDVDYIIESNAPVFTMPPAAPPTEAEIKIAEHIMPLIPNGACLQLGIGGVPNTIGNLIAQSDLQDLGVNTEMYCDAITELYEAGKITNKRKTRDVGRSTFTFCFGNKKTHEFLHNNPQIASYNCDYTNNPKYIQLEDNVISINNCVEADLLSQVCSESSGLRQISGTGGSLDFHMGAFESKGGKGILAFEATYKDKNGNLQSRIKPMLTPGAVVTVPRVMVHYIATEWGIVNMKMRSVWGRAEQMINLAHPEFRDDLLKNAREMGLWSRTNRIPF